MKVLVIYGGTSSEREISLLSGKNVGDALQTAGHTVTYFDPNNGLDTLPQAVEAIDVVFPILHGTGGEDGVIQAALEQLNVRFVGSRSAVSKACFDKWQTIQTATDILFPKTELVTFELLQNSALINNPFVLKPRAEGSSVDAFLVRQPKDFAFAGMQEVFSRHGNEMLLEELIEGQEITVGVLDDTALPVVEIIPPINQEFDFINKYNGATIENCPPKFVSETLQQQAQAIAIDLHVRMDCKDFSRTDFIIDNKGTIYALEINTLPGMTKESLFPRAAKTLGIDMPTLTDMLVTQATV